MLRSRHEMLLSLEQQRERISQCFNVAQQATLLSSKKSLQATAPNQVYIFYDSLTFLAPGSGHAAPPKRYECPR
jgi:hypothetical protein